MIPIQNLYYLLLYAWDALEQQAEIQAVAAEPKTEVLDLLAAVLNHGVDRLLRQGLQRDYVGRRESFPGIRGKVDVSATLKANLWHRGVAVCEFDELSHDILPNRILKGTIGKLLKTDVLDGLVREQLRSTWHRLHEVSEIPLTDRTFQRVLFHRNNRIDRFLIDVCRLIHGCLIPIERTGKFTFHNFLRDERRMRVVFERFIRNFYRRHAEGYTTIQSELVRWEDSIGSADDLTLLPRMRTDVTLRTTGLVLVVDAKYYLNTLQEYRGHATIRSGHLYQLFTYLKNVAATTIAHEDVEGLLIYPLTTRPLYVDLRIHGHRMRVTTLDLSQPWSGIHADLLMLLPSVAPPR
jgi:5-methylcytosine-specific restriction enzyme subunit McrC